MPDGKDKPTFNRSSVVDRRSVLTLAGSAVLASLLGTTAEASETALGKTLVLDASGDEDSCTYDIATSGDIRAMDEAENTSYTISDRRVSGTIDSDYAAFQYSGEVTSVEQSGEMVAYMGSDGDSHLPEPAHELVIRSPTEIAYEFTTSSEIEPIYDGSDEEAEPGNDAVTLNDDGTYTATGYTGNGYGDSFRFRGSVDSFSPMEGKFDLILDGTDVTSYELTGEEPDSGPAIGGGDGYERTVSQADASVVVSSRSGLADALHSATAGDVVFVDGAAAIDMGSTELIVPEGVTLASNRGVDGASGARLYTDDHPWAMLEIQSNARVTGLELQGPRTEWESDTVTELCMDAQGSGIEIDNVNGHGWGYAAVRTADDTHVHHCTIHHNTRKGHGYGVATENSANPIIEYNEFSYNRHSVQGYGGGYTVRYNHVKQGAISHVFDQHKPGGTTMRIHHNTVEVVENDSKDKKVPAVAIRGVPSNVADIHDNWFYNPEEPRETPNDWTDEAIIQVHTDSWENVVFTNNHYGAIEPASDIGHPR